MTEHSPAFLAHYRPSYGRSWSPAAPDYSRCCEIVIGQIHSGQCTRKNGHGPDGAYCKQHDPIAIKAKIAASDAKWRAEQDAKARQAEFANDCKAAIREIAAGHNDPRALAQSIIDKLEGAK